MLILLFLVVFFPEFEAQWETKKHKYLLKLQGLLAGVLNSITGHNDAIFHLEWDDKDKKHAEEGHN